MVHGPFVQSGHFFKLVGVSAQLDELQTQTGNMCVELPAGGRVNETGKACATPFIHPVSR